MMGHVRSGGRDNRQIDKSILGGLGEKYDDEALGALKMGDNISDYPGLFDISLEECILRSQSK